MTTDESPDATVTPKRRPRAWVWIAAAALLVLAPAGWLGAEYALDLEEMAGIRSQVDGVGELIERTSGEPADAGEASACDRAGERLSTLESPPWWRHVAFTLLEREQVDAAVRRLAQMRQVVAERRANREWWIGQSAAVDASLSAETRTVPDLLALMDALEAAQPEHPSSGGVGPLAKDGAARRIEAETVRLTDAQDQLIRQYAVVADRVAAASDTDALDAALADAPGPSVRDLNPPELDLVRERVQDLAQRVRAELALRDQLDSAVAAALSRVLALEPESASTGEARAILMSIESIEVPGAPRYANVSRAKAEALDAARRRTALLEARDLDRDWLDGIARAAASAATARDAIDILERLEEQPPGNCGLTSIGSRTVALAESVRSRLQARRDRSRQWREMLAEGVDAVVAARTLHGLAESSGHVERILARGDDDPSSSEDAQAARAARAATQATVARLVREQLAPVAEAIERMTDPRSIPGDVAAAIAPDSPLSSIEAAKPALAALRARVESKRAEFEAFDGAIARARATMEAGDACAAAEALASATPRDAQQEWIRADMRGALAEVALEEVESLVLSEGSLGPAGLRRLETIAQCTALAECAPDAVRMAMRVWTDARSASDRALWEDCRATARAALDRRDALTYVGALTRYLSSPGSMADVARAARDAFAVPEARVVVSEFRWGNMTCTPTDVLTDLTVTVDGETWSGPIPTAVPGRAIRLSREWEIASGAEVVLSSASGVVPCDEPEPFTGLAEITLSDRRFGATLSCDCVPVGGASMEDAHTLVLRVSPSQRWLAAIALPPWRPADDAEDQDPRADDHVPSPRPESEDDIGATPTPTMDTPPQ